MDANKKLIDVEIINENVVEKSPRERQICVLNNKQPRKLEGRKCSTLSVTNEIRSWCGDVGEWSKRDDR